MQNKEFVQLTYPIINGEQMYDYDQMKNDLALLQNIYPFIQSEVIGKSVCGRDIIHLKIGEGKTKIHVNASFHGNEWLTTSILMLFINEYCLTLSNNQLFGELNPNKLFNDFTFSFVPMVNPDGVNLVIHGPDKECREKVERINKDKYDYTWWKANVNGVDLNNQFPANWNIEKERKEAKFPSPRDYPGDYPLSEPEAIAMAKLAYKEKIDLLFALHSQGKEIYWGYEGKEPIGSVKLVGEMVRVSGYKEVKFIDSHAGYRDWFINEFRKAGFTIEVGKGVNPLPKSSFQMNYEDVKNIILSVCK